MKGVWNGRRKDEGIGWGGMVQRKGSLLAALVKLLPARAIGVMSTSSLNRECPIIRKATLKPQLQMVINCMEFTMNLLSFI